MNPFQHKRLVDSLRISKDRPMPVGLQMAFLGVE